MDDERCRVKIAHDTGVVVQCQRLLHEHVHWAEAAGMWSDDDDRIITEDPISVLETLNEVRKRIGELTQPLGPAESTLDGLERLVDKLRFTETGWQQAVSRYMEYERTAYVQRQRANAGLALTGDPEAEVVVLSLLSPGHSFSQVEDYGLALDWAVRAYHAGMTRTEPSDVVDGSSFKCGGFNCPCNDDQPCTDPNCAHRKENPAKEEPASTAASTT